MRKVFSSDDHLVQNEFGCIRVVRSSKPEEFRRWLSEESRCDIEIVPIQLDPGMARKLRGVLADFPLSTDWSEGSREVRLALENVVGHPIPWLFAYDASKAIEWVSERYRRRTRTSVCRLLQAHIDRISSAAASSFLWDSEVFRAVRLVNGDEAAVQLVLKDLAGRTVCEWIDPVSGARGVVPEYTSDLEAALRVWPDDLRPSSYAGTAMNCCLDALVVIHARMCGSP